VSMPLVVWNVSYWVWHPGCGVHATSASAAAVADMCVAAGWRCAAQLVDGTGGRNYFVAVCAATAAAPAAHHHLPASIWPIAASMVWPCTSALACRIPPVTDIVTPRG
jgi:hypothetical protein